MSRLDVMIERLQAQRACIEWSATRVSNLPGVVFELGLGSGRTYDHLRQCMPEREIYVFDRALAAHPNCVPGERHLILGEIRSSLPGICARFAGQVVLLHADIGAADHLENERIARDLAPWIAQLMHSGGILISNRPEMAFDGDWELPMPPGVVVGHCFMFCAAS